MHKCFIYKLDKFTLQINIIMIRCSATILFLLAIFHVHVNLAEVRVPENLGTECFDCKCPRNLDYQAGK